MAFSKKTEDSLGELVSSLRHFSELLEGVSYRLRGIDSNSAKMLMQMSDDLKGLDDPYKFDSLEHFNHELSSTMDEIGKALARHDWVTDNIRDNFIKLDKQRQSVEQEQLVSPEHVLEKKQESKDVSEKSEDLMKHEDARQKKSDKKVDQDRVIEKSQKPDLEKTDEPKIDAEVQENMIKVLWQVRMDLEMYIQEYKEGDRRMAMRTLNDMANYIIGASRDGLVSKQIRDDVFGIVNKILDNPDNVNLHQETLQKFHDYWDKKVGKNPESSKTKEEKTQQTDDVLKKQKEQQPIIPEEIKKEQKSQVPEVQKEKAEKTQQSKDVLQKPMDVMAREDVRQNSNMERDFDNKFNLADTAFASYSKTAQDFLTGFKYAAYQGNPNNWQDVLSKWNLPVNAPDNLIKHKYREMLAELDSAASNMGDGEAGYFFEKLTGDYMRLRGKPGFKWVAPAKGWRESTYNRYMYGKQQEQQTIKPEEIKKEQKTQMPEIQKEEPPLSQKLEMMWALDDVLENQNSKDSNSFDKMWNGLREASDKGLLSEEMKQEYRNVIKWAKEEHASKSDAVEKLSEVLTAQRDKLADKDPFLQFAQSERDALFPKKKTEKTQQNKDVLQKPADLRAPEDVKKDEKRQAVADFKSGTQKVLDLDKQIEQDKQKKLNQAALAAHRRKILLNRGNGNV